MKNLKSKSAMKKIWNTYAYGNSRALICYWWAPWSRSSLGASMYKKRFLSWLQWPCIFSLDALLQHLLSWFLLPYYMNCSPTHHILSYWKVLHLWRNDENLETFVHRMWYANIWKCFHFSFIFKHIWNTILKYALKITVIDVFSFSK